ncbi:YgiQ family radical SAM protein, partial [Myxococcus sp. AM001]|nr:YgiQ family radical SAM protein [Myxococcus sp. AM001]
GYQSARRKNSTPAGSKKVAGASAAKSKPMLTQHTGLPPRDTGAAGGNPWDKREQAKAAAQVRNQQAAKERADAAKGKGKKPVKKPAVPR